MKIRMYEPRNENAIFELVGSHISVGQYLRDKRSRLVDWPIKHAMQPRVRRQGIYHTRYWQARLFYRAHDVALDEGLRFLYTTVFPNYMRRRRFVPQIIYSRAYR